MSMVIGSLSAVMALKTKKFVNQLSKTRQRLKAFSRGFRQSFTFAKVAAGAATLSIGRRLFEMGASVIEAQNLVGVSFGDMSKDAAKWANEIEDRLGASSIELQKETAVLFLLAQSMEVAKKGAFKLATGLGQLAVDIGSLREMPVEEAFQKLRSGLTGQVKPLRALGIGIEIFNLDQEAMRLGLTRTGSEWSNSEKAILRYSLIVRQAKADLGDLANTITSPANQMKVLKAKIKAVEQGAGLGLIPMLMRSITWLNTTGESAGTMGDLTVVAMNKMTGATSVIATAVEALGQGFKFIFDTTFFKGTKAIVGTFVGGLSVAAGMTISDIGSLFGKKKNKISTALDKYGRERVQIGIEALEGMHKDAIELGVFAEELKAAQRADDSIFSFLTHRFEQERKNLEQTFRVGRAGGIKGLRQPEFETGLSLEEEKKQTNLLQSIHGRLEAGLRISVN